MKNSTQFHKHQSETLNPNTQKNQKPPLNFSHLHPKPKFSSILQRPDIQNPSQQYKQTSHSPSIHSNVAQAIIHQSLNHSQQYSLHQPPTYKSNKSIPKSSSRNQINGKIYKSTSFEAPAPSSAQVQKNRDSSHILNSNSERFKSLNDSSGSGHPNTTRVSKVGPPSEKNFNQEERKILGDVTNFATNVQVKKEPRPQMSKPLNLVKRQHSMRYKPNDKIAGLNQSAENQKQTNSYRSQKQSLDQAGNFNKENQFFDQNIKKPLTIQHESTKFNKKISNHRQEVMNSLVSQFEIPHYEPTKCSVKKNGMVRAYAANTNQGLVRNYNEDRVSIILNILKPSSRSDETWPPCSFFGVYDGHGGSACSDFLRDNLHQIIVKERTFPLYPEIALQKGFEKAEQQFINTIATEEDRQGNKYLKNKSGSTAIVVMIVGEECYVANVGDSRAVISCNGGERSVDLSKDHKPGDAGERRRIDLAGGYIYQQTGQGTVINGSGERTGNSGPVRVFPGRLSVSRTFGDVEAKITQFGGNSRVVTCKPDISQFKISSVDHDFIVLASDGIFDRLSTDDVVQSVWKSAFESKSKSIHQQSGLGVEFIIKNAMHKQTSDNVTVALIALPAWKNQLFPKLLNQQSIFPLQPVPINTPPLQRPNSKLNHKIHQTFARKHSNDKVVNVNNRIPISQKQRHPSRSKQETNNQFSSQQRSYDQRSYCLPPSGQNDSLSQNRTNSGSREKSGVLNSNSSYCIEKYQMRLLEKKNQGEGQIEKKRRYSEKNSSVGIDGGCQ